MIILAILPPQKKSDLGGLGPARLMYALYSCIANQKDRSHISCDCRFPPCAQLHSSRDRSYRLSCVHLTIVPEVEGVCRCLAITAPAAATLGANNDRHMTCVAFRQATLGQSA